MQDTDISLEKIFNKSDRILADIQNQRAQNKTILIEEEKMELVVFTLKNNYFAFYGSNIREILPYEESSFVPGCPAVIIGIINVRGDIESVLNLHKLIGLPEKNITKESRIIIASADNIVSGILVDSVQDVIEIPKSSIKRPISMLDNAVKAFTVGGETIYNGEYVNILDVGKIFAKMTA